MAERKESITPPESELPSFPDTRIKKGEDGNTYVDRMAEEWRNRAQAIVDNKNLNRWATWCEDVNCLARSIVRDLNGAEISVSLGRWNGAHMGNIRDYIDEKNKDLIDKIFEDEKVGG